MVAEGGPHCPCCSFQTKPVFFLFPKPKVWLSSMCQALCTFPYEMHEHRGFNLFSLKYQQQGTSVQMLAADSTPSLRKGQSHYPLRSTEGQERWTALQIPVDNEPHQPTQRSRVLGTSKWGNRSVFYTNPALDGDPALSPPHPHEGAAIGGKFCGLWRLVREQKPRPLARVLRVG